MIDLMDCKTKEEEIKRFFIWLFDNEDIQLKSEIDLTLATDYFDPYIYYPVEIERFFKTKAMKRIAKVSQLGEVLNSNKNCYQNRLEHSKGTYYKKLEELIFLYKKEDYRKYIEDNNMKLYLIAELIKEAGHDIGHPPLSHGMEVKVIGKRGIHEDIGMRILTEDNEIKSVLEQIDSRLPSIFYKCLKTDILNSKVHDESNYDVDRLDYLNRDSLYSGEKISLSNQEYSILYAKLDSEGNIQKNADGSIFLADKKDTKKKRIDVYESDSLPKIESCLEQRMNGYENIYCSAESQVRSSCIGLCMNEVLNCNLPDARELQECVNNMKHKDVKDVDIVKYIEWDELRFYKECIKVAQKSNNEHLKNLACMVVPPLDALMNFTYSGLEIHNQKDKKEYTGEEVEFINILKQLIKGNDDISKNMKNNKFFYSNCKWTSDSEKIRYLKLKWGDRINYSNVKIKGYKKSTPIYTKDKNGRIFEIQDNPDCLIDWNNQNREIEVAFIVPELLRLKGISEEEIKAIIADFTGQDYSGKDNVEGIAEQKNIMSVEKKDRIPIKKRKINMSPVRVGNSVGKYFDDLEL